VKTGAVDSGVTTPMPLKAMALRMTTKFERGRDGTANIEDQRIAIATQDTGTSSAIEEIE
jgi:hypothetical protein